MRYRSNHPTHNITGFLWLRLLTRGQLTGLSLNTSFAKTIIFLETMEAIPLKIAMKNASIVCYLRQDNFHCWSVFRDNWVELKNNWSTNESDNPHQMSSHCLPNGANRMYWHLLHTKFMNGFWSWPVTNWLERNDMDSLFRNWSKLIVNHLWVTWSTVHITFCKRQVMNHSKHRSGLALLTIIFVPCESPKYDCRS